MNHALPLRRDALRRGGFTLIEVVIALAIFLFGALAIVRIFPPALGIIQNSGDQLTAINLNRSTLAQLEKSPDQVPDWIHDPSTAIFPGSVVGTASRNASLPRTNLSDFPNTALSHFRMISGEKQIVRDGDASLTPVPLYVVTRYPYASEVSVCEEDEVEGVVMQPDGRLDFSNAKLESTGADFRDSSNPIYPPLTGGTGVKTYANGQADGALSARQDTVFYVSYSWIENNNIQSVVDEPLVYRSSSPLPPLPTAVTVQGQRKAAGTATDPVVGPVKVRFRRLRFRTNTLPTVQTAPTYGDNIRGYANLNDTSALPNSPALFTAGEKVSLDYTVADWRWLVSNETPSVKPEGIQANDNYRAVITPVHFFDKDQDLYTLLINQNKDQAKGTYTGGAPLLTGTGTGFPPPANVADPVDAKKGQVILDLNTFPNIATNPMTFARSRVVYRTLDNWAQQLSVASKSYKPNYSNNAPLAPVPSEPWRDYVYGNDGYLYFHPSEAGKSIAVSYIYRVLGTTPVDIEVSKRVLSVEQDTITTPNAAATRVETNGLVSRLALTDNEGKRVTDNNTELNAIRAVLGASIQARTAWIDGDKFTQVSSVGLRAVNN